MCSQGRAFGPGPADCASGDHYSIDGQAQAVWCTDTETGANLLRVISRPCIVSYHTSSQGMGSSSHFKLSAKYTGDLNRMKGFDQRPANKAPSRIQIQNIANIVFKCRLINVDAQQ